MKTKDELIEFLKGFAVGDTPTVPDKEMSAIFYIGVDRPTVEAWLKEKEVGLSGFELKNAGCGPTAAWVFERKS